MRFDLLDRKVVPPLRYPNGEFVLYCPFYTLLAPNEIKRIPLSVFVACDDKEAFVIRTYPDLFERKRVAVMTFSRNNGVIELFIQNTNPITPPQNVLQTLMRAYGTQDIAPGEPIAFLTPVRIEK